MTAALRKLADTLRAHLSLEAAAWLDEALAAVADDPAAIRTRFPAVGRKVGRAPIQAVHETSGEAPWTADEAARALLLAALDARVVNELGDLYRYGDAAERRAILRCLHLLEVGEHAVPLVLDALRTNDERLVAAAMGRYALEHLDDHMLRQAVLKCVFMGIPLAAIPGLDARADAELARMLASYVHERVAAGRDVPNDVWPLIDRFPPDAELAALNAELHADADTRRRASENALAQRQAARRRS